MDRQLLDHLRKLSPSDLQTVLARRPEARAVLAGPRRDLPALAEILGAPDSIALAVLSLDGFLGQLIAAAQWVGPQAPASAIARLAAGVDPTDLRAGAEELARWGLAFPVDRAADPLGWVLSLPGCVDMALDMGGEGANLVRRLLAGRSPEFLALVAHHIGLPGRPHPNIESIIAEIGTALSEPQRVQGLLEEAPAAAQHLFRHLQDEGGVVSRHELMVRGYLRWSDPPWSDRRKVQTHLDWLESRGLVMLDASRSYTGSAVIPAEVEFALKEKSPFAQWPPRLPPPLAVPGATAPSRTGDPSKILAEMETLLQTWAEAPPAGLAKGGLGMRELRRAAKLLGFPEAYTIFLYALAVEAGLLGEDEQSRVVPTDEAKEWMALPAPERWQLLLTGWLEARVWSEQEDNGLLPLDQAVPRLWALHMRRALVEELAALGPEEATDAEHLVARLVWRYPMLLHDDTTAATVVRRALEALSWLGICSGPSPAALLEPGRSAAVSEGWTSGDNPGTAAFAPEVDTVTVGADLTVIVPGPPVRVLREALGRFGDLTAASPARVYRISEASLRRALDGGMQAGDILGLLERHAPRGVPQNVAYLIEDVGRRHGSLVVGAATFYLRSEDPALLGAVVAERKVAAWHPRLIAPTVALLDAPRLDALLSALRQAGYLPVAEDDAGALVRPSASLGVVPLLPAYDYLRPLTGAQVAALAETLVSGRPEPVERLAPRRPAPVLLHGEATNGEPHLLDGTTYRSREQIRRLLDAAVDHDATVEIHYRPSRGRPSTRLIEPYFSDPAGVGAWDRSSRQERDFELGRIEWARAVKEPVPTGGWES